VGVDPAVTPVANPPVVIVAPGPAAHVANAVRSCEVASEKFPVALNCTVWPTATDGAAGAITIPLSRAFTVIVMFVVTAPDVAVTIATPGDTAVINPLWLTVTDGEPELHATLLVRTGVVVSELVPVATNWKVWPTCSHGAGEGVIARLCKIGVPTVNVAEPCTEPVCAVMTDVARPRSTT
jgi:hypothetical protein